MILVQMQVLNLELNYTLFKFFSYKAECNCYTPETYFNDHFKLRSELSYNKLIYAISGNMLLQIKLLIATQLKVMREVQKLQISECN
jgi:hypothetical protein